MIFPKPKTFRSKRYLDFIRQHSCLVCNAPHTVPHHVGLGKNMQSGKPPDSHCLPLCPKHHDEHGSGATNNRFWEEHRIDPKLEIIQLLTEYLDGPGERL